MEAFLAWLISTVGSTIINRVMVNAIGGTASVADDPSRNLEKFLRIVTRDFSHIVENIVTQEFLRADIDRIKTLLQASYTFFEDFSATSAEENLRQASERVIDASASLTTLIDRVSEPAREALHENAGIRDELLRLITLVGAMDFLVRSYALQFNSAGISRFPRIIRNYENDLRRVLILAIKQANSQRANSIRRGRSCTWELRERELARTVDKLKVTITDWYGLLGELQRSFLRTDQATALATVVAGRLGKPDLEQIRRRLGRLTPEELDVFVPRLAFTWRATKWLMRIGFMVDEERLVHYFPRTLVYIILLGSVCGFKIATLGETREGRICARGNGLEADLTEDSQDRRDHRSFYLSFRNDGGLALCALYLAAAVTGQQIRDPYRGLWFFHCIDKSKGRFRLQLATEEVKPSLRKGLFSTERKHYILSVHNALREDRRDGDRDGESYYLHAAKDDSDARSGDVWTPIPTNAAGTAYKLIQKGDSRRGGGGDEYGLKGGCLVMHRYYDRDKRDDKSTWAHVRTKRSPTRSGAEITIDPEAYSHEGLRRFIIR